MNYRRALLLLIPLLITERGHAAPASFQEAEALFNSGTFVKLEKVAGTALIGRCFRQGRKHSGATEGARLLVSPVESTKKRSLFKPKYDWTLLLTFSTPGADDQLTYSDIEKHLRPEKEADRAARWTKGSAKTARFADRPVEETPEGLYSEMRYWNPVASGGWGTWRNDWKLWLRKHRGYYVLQEEYQFDGHGGVDYTAFCYFFKQIGRPG